MSPSSPCFYFLLIHFHTSLLHTNLQPSSSLLDYFPCCSPQRVKMLVLSASDMWKTTVCCVSAWEYAIEVLSLLDWVLSSLAGVLSLCCFIDFCIHTWRYHAYKCNCFWTWAYISLVMFNLSINPSCLQVNHTVTRDEDDVKAEFSENKINVYALQLFHLE